ncbi:hypothetical protein D3C86_1056230 [compost metagenome]
MFTPNARTQRPLTQTPLRLFERTIERNRLRLTCESMVGPRPWGPASKAEINLIRMRRTALANLHRRPAQGRLGRLQRGHRRGRLPWRSPCARPRSRKTRPCRRAKTPWRPRPLPGRQFAFPPADTTRRKRDGMREGARLLQAPGCRPAQTRHVVHNRPGQQAVLRPADRGRIALA